MVLTCRLAAIYGLVLVCATAMVAQEGRRGPPLPPNPLPYDLLLKGGHLLDDKNKIDAVRDVGIKDGKVAAVGAELSPKDALKTIDVKGLYVAPGLIDLHVQSRRDRGKGVLCWGSVPLSGRINAAQWGDDRGGVGIPGGGTLTISRTRSSIGRRRGCWQS